jgi:hypothetical protein
MTNVNISRGENEVVTVKRLCFAVCPSTIGLELRLKFIERLFQFFRNPKEFSHSDFASLNVHLYVIKRFNKTREDKIPWEKLATTALQRVFIAARAISPGSCSAGR